MTFRFLQRLSEFLQQLSDFPQRLFAFRENQENLFMARSIRKIAIRASYFLPLAPRASQFLLNNTYVSPNNTKHGSPLMTDIIWHRREYLRIHQGIPVEWIHAPVTQSQERVSYIHEKGIDFIPDN